MELASLLKTKHQLGHGHANANANPNSNSNSNSMVRTFWLKSENLIKDTS